MDLRSIARALGGEVSGSQILAPGPGHSPRDRSLSIRFSPGAPDGFIVFSHAGDDFKACRDYVRGRLGLPANDWKRDRTDPPKRPVARPVKTADDDNAKRLKIAARIVSELKPIAGTPGEVYLHDIRKIDVAAVKDVLSRTDAIGWHAAVLFREEGRPLDGQRIGCIIGVMTDPLTAKPTGAISRTYLAPDLMKVGKAKTLGSPAGIVRLSHDADALEGLFITEGLELALAGMSKGVLPMWSIGSTAQMAKFPVLAGVERLTILADNDANGDGVKAGREVAERWRSAGREVRLWCHKAPGDLNDVVRRFAIQ